MKLAKHASMVALAVIPLLSYGRQQPEVLEVATLKEEYTVGGIEFTADGSQLITMAGAYSKEAHVWAWQEEKHVVTLQNAHATPLTGTPSRASPDGKYWARCGNPVTVWDTHTWEPIVTLPGTFPEDAAATTRAVSCNAIAFSSNSDTMIVLQRTLAMVDDAPSIVAYETKGWQRRWSLRTPPFYPKSVAYSPDGNSIAIGGSVTNVKSSTLPGKIPTFGEPPLPDTGLIAIIDPAKHSISRTIQIPETIYTSSQDVSWSRDGRTISFGANAAIRTFVASSGVQQEVLMAESQFSRPRIFPSPDGKYRIETGFGEENSTVRLVDKSGPTRKVLHEIRARPAHIAWSRDSRYFALAGAAVSLANLSPWLELLAPNSGKVIIYEIRQP